jgi:hexosaminidase
MVKAPAAWRSFTFNKATGKPVQYGTPNSKYYPANGPATLTDGMRGTDDAGKQWHAFEANDMVATIDMGKPVTASFASLGCLQNYNQWIFFPQWVKFEISSDGEHYTDVGTANNTIPVTDRASQIKDFGVHFDARTFRYLRITAKNLGKCPKGHPGEGKGAWLFCDEVIVE